MPEQFWAAPGFRRTTYLLSWLWAAIFLITTLSYVVRHTPRRLLTEAPACCQNHVSPMKHSDAPGQSEAWDCEEPASASSQGSMWCRG